MPASLCSLKHLLLFLQDSASPVKMSSVFTPGEESLFLSLVSLPQADLTLMVAYPAPSLGFSQ